MTVWSQTLLRVMITDGKRIDDCELWIKVDETMAAKELKKDSNEDSEDLVKQINRALTEPAGGFMMMPSRGRAPWLLFLIEVFSLSPAQFF